MALPNEIICEIFKNCDLLTLFKIYQNDEMRPYVIEALKLSVEKLSPRVSYGWKNTNLKDTIIFFDLTEMIPDQSLKTTLRQRFAVNENIGVSLMLGAGILNTTHKITNIFYWLEQGKVPKTGGLNFFIRFLSEVFISSNWNHVDDDIKKEIYAMLLYDKISGLRFDEE
jgi:hypothetical protein